MPIYAGLWPYSTFFLPLSLDFALTVHISAAVPVAPNNCILVEPSGSYGVSGSQQPQNTNFDQNLPIGAL